MTLSSRRLTGWNRLGAVRILRRRTVALGAELDGRRPVGQLFSTIGLVEDRKSRSSTLPAR